MEEKPNKKNKENQVKLFGHRKQLHTVHWKDGEEMHKAMHVFDGSFRALLLELDDQPLSIYEMRNYIQRMEKIVFFGKGSNKSQFTLRKDLTKAVEQGLLEECEGKYRLTPKGKEMSHHMQQMIPRFMNWFFSAETVSKVSLIIHALLGFLKLGIGFLSHSAGLIADGIDNGVDMVSSILVWLGVKHNKEKLVSIFVVVTMFVSVGGVGIATYQKIIHPTPVTEGILALAISGFLGLVMLGVSAYQYVVGKMQNNIAVLCQSVDSRNHFWTSIMVCIGILLSSVSSRLEMNWLLYGDGVASGLIGFMILKSAVELLRELMKPGGESTEISHFVGTALDRGKEKIVFDWLRLQLTNQGLSVEELQKRFKANFYQKPPRIYTLTGMDSLSQTGQDLRPFLDRWVTRKKLIEDDGFYWLIE